MASGDSSDILMIFEDDAGSLLSGESTTEVTSSSRIGQSMLKGFRKNAIFELESFGLSIGDSSGAMGRAKGNLMPNMDQLAQIHALAAHAARQVYQSQQKGPLTDPKKEVAVQEVTFSRLMDRSSNELLKHFILRTNFKRAALVKRKSAGGNAAGEPYLRFDFRRVLLTKANWSNDDPVKEDYAFYCRAITMHYRPQLPDGSLGAVIPGFWSMVPNDSPDTL